MPKKIYFYSPSMQMYHRDLSDTSGWVNAVPIYLSAHLKRTRPDLVNQIEWTGYSLEPLDQEALINDINSNAIDLLLVSIFVWNQEHVYNNLKDIKQRINRPLKIIVGGPSVDPFRNKNYFVEHPEIDYAVYAQGEEAFANVLDHLINDKKLSLLSSKNLAWQQDGQMKLGDFEFLRLKEGSPYMESADVTQWIADQTINNPKYKDIRFWFPYESSKGCPYDCTYCDWTSGLTHKVYHRQFNIEDEFNFLGTMGFTGFAFVDANFGQHRQDIDITQTMIKLNKEKGYGFEIVAINMSKLKTKENFIILDLLYGANILKNIFVAVQDNDLQVLEDINRPAVPWNEVVDFIIPFKKKYPNAYMRSDLILGLPGQTRDSWENTILSTIEHLKLVHNAWIVLPSSPAGYDSAYREKMKIKTKNIKLGADTAYECVVETYSYNTDDYLYNTLISEMVVMLQNKMTVAEIKTIIDQAKHSKHLESAIAECYIAVDNPDFTHNMIVIAKKFTMKLFLEYSYPKEFVKNIAKYIIQYDQIA